MDTWVWNQICLKFVQVHVQGAVKAKTRGNRTDDLRNQTVQMLVAWSRDIQVAVTDIVDSLVIYQESAVGVFDGAVG